MAAGWRSDAMSCFLNQEWRQRPRFITDKHPGWVHQLLNPAPRTLRDDSQCQPRVPPRSCCSKAASSLWKGPITTFYDPKNSILFFWGNNFKGKWVHAAPRYTQGKLSIWRRKGIPPSYFVVMFDFVLQQRAVYVQCVSGGGHMW